MFNFVNCDVIVGGEDFTMFIYACNLLFVCLYVCVNSTLVFKFYLNWGLTPQNRGKCSVFGGGLFLSL